VALVGPDVVALADPVVGAALVRLVGPDVVALADPVVGADLVAPVVHLHPAADQGVLVVAEMLLVVVATQLVHSGALAVDRARAANLSGLSARSSTTCKPRRSVGLPCRWAKGSRCDFPVARH
jgi:hypothetical protein